jgi:hypothetical protein
LRWDNGIHAAPARRLEDGMSEAETERRMAELDRLLNDPETRMDAHRVWTLLAELSRAAQPAAPRA